MDPIVTWTFGDMLPDRAFTGPACMLEGLKIIRSGLKTYKEDTLQAVLQYLKRLASAQASNRPSCHHCVSGIDDLSYSISSAMAMSYEAAVFQGRAKDTWRMAASAVMHLGCSRMRRPALAESRRVAHGSCNPALL